MITSASRALLVAALFVSCAHADIYQWEYADPASGSRIRQESSTTCPDGAGRDALPDADLSNLDLSMAWLPNKDLTGVNFQNTNLSTAYLLESILTNTNFTGANLTTVVILGDYYDSLTFSNSNLTESTIRIDGDTYHNHSYHNLSFENANLTDAALFLYDSWLEGRLNLDNAILTNALLNSEFYSASIMNADLTDAWLFGEYIDARFDNSTLRGAHIRSNITGAHFTNADLTNTDFRESGITQQQIDQAAAAEGLINNEGYVRQFNLGSGDSRLIDAPSSDDEAPVTVVEGMNLASDSHLQLKAVMHWFREPLITFASPDTPVSLGGTLEIEIVSLDDIDFLFWDNTTIQFFDWNNADVTGWFDEIIINTPIGTFDTTSLATDGTATFNLSNIIPGDANLDNTVDLLDLAILADSFNTSDDAYWWTGDFNEDLAVDLLDLSILAANFGTTNVPAPATLTISALALMITARRN
ncbi:pentapeptide repeat-containing protein [Mucisphaera calidilacus]|uniref:Pentapeptide repeats (8 copies) n=1 Tax=Mucisphaera calidilacus TaxID=2527982 RepID=A0A518BV59_9BACT|nr:pentapeptide repeat-containing protein [Mucisphaera calidilacus]QDU70824.1 Pentapeptide repeats (8 copies) [Mucisphaera calidilacus]